MNKLLLAVFALSLIGCENETPEEIASRELSNERNMRVSMVQIGIEKMMRDPDSVEYEFKAYNIDNDAVCFDYRAKNGFGGYVKENIVVLSDNSIYQSNKAYNKHCPSNANYEIY